MESSAAAPVEVVQEDTVEVVIVGAGLAGLQCARTLVNDHGIDPSSILIVEAQDYIGGRVKQNNSLIPGVKIDCGAEIIHGKGHVLHDLAVAQNEKLTDVYTWAHGDGGPEAELVNGHFGMYFSKTMGNKFFRYNDNDQDFCKLNETLFELADLDPLECEHDLSLRDHLVSKGIANDMLAMANAGYANTVCANSETLSLRQTVRWENFWRTEDEGDSRPDSSFSFVVDHLVDAAPSLRPRIRLNTVVSAVVSTPSESEQPEKYATQIVCKNSINGEETVFRACQCVVTVSAHVMKEGMIHFSPALPESIRNAYKSLDFNNAIKVVASFKRRCWPKNLDGIIMAGTTIPEIWFHDDVIAESSEASCYATGFLTGAYAERLMALSEGMTNIPKEALAAQLDDVWQYLKPQDLPGGHPIRADGASSTMPSAQEEFIDGFVYNWREQHPHIGGGYASMRAKNNADVIPFLSESFGNVSFAGEATEMPGATAHAALTSGKKVAAKVHKKLQQIKN